MAAYALGNSLYGMKSRPVYLEVLALANLLMLSGRMSLMFWTTFRLNGRPTTYELVWTGGLGGMSPIKVPGSSRGCTTVDSLPRGPTLD